MFTHIRALTSLHSWANADADADVEETDVCTQICQAAAWWLLLPHQFSSESNGDA